jgi:hypothetical protein
MWCKPSWWPLLRIIYFKVASNDSEPYRIHHLCLAQSSNGSRENFLNLHWPSHRKRQLRHLVCWNIPLCVFFALRVAALAFRLANLPPAELSKTVKSKFSGQFRGVAWDWVHLVYRASTSNWSTVPGAGWWTSLKYLRPWSSETDLISWFR